jgi:hypothetical protein
MASINVTKLGQVLKLLVTSSAPASPENGMCYYDTGSSTFKFYQGGAWISLGDASAILASSITSGDTTHAPTGSAVYTALAGKLGTGAQAADSATLQGHAASYFLASGAQAADSAELGGQLPAYYATASSLSSYLPLAGGIMTGNIDMGSGLNHKIINLETPTAANDAANKSYVDTLVVTGSKVKEALLTQVQMSNAQGILAAEIFDMDAQPNPSDTLVITDGTNVETYTFGGNVTIGALLSDTYTNLKNEINSISAHWSAEYDPTLTANDPDDPYGLLVVYEKVTAAGNSTSRLYGTSTSSPVAQVIPFNGDVEYSTGKAEVTLPATDPGAGRFGFRRQVSALVDGEIHVTLDLDVLSSWNASLAAWVTLSANSIPDATSGSGGATHGKVTADSDKGLTISSGVLAVKVDNSTIDFGTGSLEVKAHGIADAQISTSAAIALSKLAELTGHNKVLVSSNSGVVAESSTSTTTLGYLDATSSVQTQLNAKAPSASPTFSGTIGTALTASKVLVTDSSSNLAASTVSSTTLSYLDATSSVQTQLNAKLSSVSADTAPSLGGDLNVDSKALYSSTGLRLGSTAGNYQLNNYVHSQTLSASQTNVAASSFTFAYASYSSCIVEYQIKEATTGAVRSGQLFVSTDNTNVAVADSYTETADVGVSWLGTISGGNVEVHYTTTANDKTMRAMQKLFMA